jgi:hypothetical protein
MRCAGHNIGKVVKEVLYWHRLDNPTQRLDMRVMYFSPGV